MLLSRRLYKAVSGPEHSFSIKKEAQTWFYDRYHHHPEFEFTYIEKGEGIRFVGDHIEPFHRGEIVLLGPNLSHMWKCDNRFYQQKDHAACCSYVIHFPKKLIDNITLNIPEFNPVKILLEKSKQGIKIEGKHKTLLIRAFRQLPRQQKSERLLTLLQMLHWAASEPKNQLLSQSYTSRAQEDEQSERINIIYNFLLNAFHEKVTLEKTASVANMSPTAFCRFFKQKTGKSLVEVLNEIRINHACRLLLEAKDKVAQVALASGFTNLSHFNKQFKNITGKTPREFTQG